jgi:hypothetical protein
VAAEVRAEAELQTVAPLLQKKHSRHSDGCFLGAVAKDIAHPYFKYTLTDINGFTL